jgi:hypothetical protein
MNDNWFVDIFFEIEIWQFHNNFRGPLRIAECELAFYSLKELMREE